MSFIYAGTTALMMHLAGLASFFWCLSFVALTPFLLRIRRSDRSESVRLGMLLGLSYFGLRISDSLLLSPTSALCLLSGGTASFVLLSLAIWFAKE